MKVPLGARLILVKHKRPTSQPGAPEEERLRGLVGIWEGEGALDGTRSTKNAASSIQRGARSTYFREQAYIP